VPGSLEMAIKFSTVAILWLTPHPRDLNQPEGEREGFLGLGH